MDTSTEKETVGYISPFASDWTRNLYERANKESRDTVPTEGDQSLSQENTTKPLPRVESPEVPQPLPKPLRPDRTMAGSVLL